MATFGSYGNLGGELVNIVEVDHSIINAVTGSVTLYTCPVGRYALVIIRNFSTSLTLDFNYSGANKFSYAGGTAYDESTVKDKVLNEGENIVMNRPTLSLSSSSANFLIFEYRKP